MIMHVSASVRPIHHRWLNLCATVAANPIAICRNVSFAHVFISRKWNKNPEHNNTWVKWLPVDFIETNVIFLVLCWFDFIAYYFTFVLREFAASSLKHFLFMWCFSNSPNADETINAKGYERYNAAFGYGRGANILISTWNLTIHFSENVESCSTHSHLAF